MRYIFMDNFRGFSNTLIPLQQITFLVGENSTGKSSFLKLLYLLSRPQFWFSPDYSFQEDVELGSFNDIISAWSPDKSFFRVGFITFYKSSNKGQNSAKFSLLTFENREGSPYISKYCQFDGGQLLKLVFQHKRTKYKKEFLTDAFNDVESFIALFKEIINSDKTDNRGFRYLPNNIPPDPPLPIALSILRTLDKNKNISDYKFSAEIPISMNLMWIAPIRTKPQRFYDSTRKGFSPEGDHTPLLLRRSLRAKTKSSAFAKKLQLFGESSGLFDTILPRSFGRSPQSPFEILVQFSGAALNINNVGYGVSQVLPLIVEFLSQENNRTFAVQQPEVHLHPRAQAALGDLIVQLAIEKKHGFFLETHSDYLIDRCRLRIAKIKKQVAAQVVFFNRTESGNKATVIQIGKDGKYPVEQPSEFRDFFIKEEMKLLEV